MTPRSADPQPTRRRRVPPAWVVMVAGVLFLGAAALRYYGETSRPWQIQAVAGALFMAAGLVLAAIKRSFR